MMLGELDSLSQEDEMTSCIKHKTTQNVLKT